ncbi:hypothetical protein CVT26_011021 [Gymnopilus dilepis]|uniref:Uncharacterized protein n=1 Tax=Gymnopilus dilepis TaxID=231916 RepID=A0A409VY70_9AGAR|nr:hypothetical protein CVT26_011021 [Gymnopilus dilepis]
MLQPLFFSISALGVFSLIVPVLSAPAVNVKPDLQRSPSMVSTATLGTSSSSAAWSPSSTASLPFLYGKLADKFFRINDAYQGFKSYVLPDDAMPVVGPSYSSDHHQPHHHDHRLLGHSQSQSHDQKTNHHQHEHDVSDSYYGPPVPPSEYQHPKRPLFRPFASWSNKAKAYSFKDCLSTVKNVGKHVAKEA